MAELAGAWLAGLVMQGPAALDDIQFLLSPELPAGCRLPITTTAAIPDIQAATASCTPPSCPPTTPPSWSPAPRRGACPSWPATCRWAAGAADDVDVCC